MKVPSHNQNPSKKRAPNSQGEQVIDSTSDQSLYANLESVVSILRKKYADRKLQKVFRQWDVDKDGCINAEELNANLRRRGIRLSDARLKDLFSEFDVDKDGRLLYEEFREMIYGPIHEDRYSTAAAAHRKRAEETPVAQDPYAILRNAQLDAGSKHIDVSDSNFLTPPCPV